MIDISQAISRYFPVSPITVSFTATSTAWAAVNTSNFDQLYVFQPTEDCLVRVGPNGIAAADATDWLLPADQSQDFALKPGYGVRVIRATADGTLKIGSTGA
jgi:hypothetical protein